MRKNLIVSIIGAVLLIGTFFNLEKWLRLRVCVKESNEIEYQLVEIVRHDRARGDYYTAEIIYNGRQYEIDITKEMVAQLERGIKPIFYHCSNDDIISGWTARLAYRLSLLFGAGFILLLIAWVKNAKK